MSHELPMTDDRQRVPNEVRNLYRGTDIGGGPDGADGFNCPKCNGQIVTKSW